MTQYNWQHPGWPSLEYDLSEVQILQYCFTIETNYLAGGLKQLPDNVWMDALDHLRCQPININGRRGAIVAKYLLNA